MKSTGAPCLGLSPLPWLPSSLGAKSKLLTQALLHSPTHPRFLCPHIFCSLAQGALPAWGQVHSCWHFAWCVHSPRPLPACLTFSFFFSLFGVCFSLKVTSLEGPFLTNQLSHSCHITSLYLHQKVCICGIFVIFTYYH